MSAPVGGKSQTNPDLDMRVAPPFALLLPVFAMASGVLFLGERLTLIVGGLLALAGVAFFQGRLSAQPK
jgi:drug/metabolite transporter (DMT)-like permease